MIPSVDTRLASMSSAVTGAILPALGTSNASAAEQAALLAGHIGVLRAQLPVSEEFEQLDYNRSRSYARKLLVDLAGGECTQVAARQLRDLLDGPVPFTLPQLRFAQDELAAATGTLIEAGGVDGSPDYQAASFQVCLCEEREQSIRSRSFFGMMGYEDGSTPIPDLDDMMSEFRSSYGAGRGDAST